MSEILRIPDGNAFKLRVTGTLTNGNYTENADFSVVHNLVVNFVRRGRDAMDAEVDASGRIVAECDGTLARGLYGLELRGYYNGQNWRFFEKDLFMIVDEGAESDEPTEIIDVPVYDLAVNVSFGGTGVTAAYVDAAVEAHDNDTNAHSALLGAKVDDVLVDGNSVVSEENGEDGKTYRVARISLSGINADIDDLQEQIDAIVADKATVALTVTPSLVYVGTQNAITLRATSSVAASAISISGGNIASAVTGSGTSLSASDSITPSGNTSYLATFVVAGVTKTVTKSVTAVRPVYYGSGSVYTDAGTVASIRSSAAGTYNVTVGTIGTYIFFVVPSSMSISGATMNGFDFPLETAANVVKDGVAYKSYRSSNTLDAGTYSIVIR